jgi:hypothetical protein
MFRRGRTDKLRGDSRPVALVAACSGDSGVPISGAVTASTTAASAQDSSASVPQPACQEFGPAVGQYLRDRGAQGNIILDRELSGVPDGGLGFEWYWGCLWTMERGMPLVSFEFYVQGPMQADLDLREVSTFLRPDTNPDAVPEPISGLDQRSLFAYYGNGGGAVVEMPGAIVDFVMFGDEVSPRSALEGLVRIVVNQLASSS